MPRQADIVASAWIRSVRLALKLSQDQFGERVRAEGGRDTVAKWESSGRPTEPRFTFTRRIVTIAPPELVKTFVGRPDLQPQGLDLETHAGKPGRSIPEGPESMPPETEHVPSVQAAALAEALDEITDKGTRSEVLRKCLNLIAEAHHPSELDAATRPNRVQRK